MGQYMRDAIAWCPETGVSDRVLSSLSLGSSRVSKEVARA